MRYQVTMTHTEKTFELLSRMQYDLFCKGNRVARTILSFGLVLLGVVYGDQWWGILVIAYGCYLTTSTYSAANHTAHKLSKGITQSGMAFPSSRYDFGEDRMEIVSLQNEKHPKSSLAYKDVRKIGEDGSYFYIFRDNRGGYMIPKAELSDEDSFRSFLESRTGLVVESRVAPIVRLMRKYRQKKNEPWHL